MTTQTRNLPPSRPTLLWTSFMRAVALLRSCDQASLPLPTCPWGSSHSGLLLFPSRSQGQGLCTFLPSTCPGRYHILGLSLGHCLKEAFSDHPITIRLSLLKHFINIYKYIQMCFLFCFFSLPPFFPSFLLSCHYTFIEC